MEKEIKQGTVYGFDLVLKVTTPVDEKIINEKTLSKLIEDKKIVQ